MNNRLLTILLIVSSLTAYSQTNQGLYFGGNVGMNFLTYSIEGGSSKPKLSYGGNLGYVYYFSPSWGIGTGVGAYLCTTDGHLDGAIISIENRIDDEGDMHRADLYFRDWHEIQKFLLVEIPILLHYQYDFGLRKRNIMYLRMGVKVQLPMMATYDANGQIEEQRFYPEWRVPMFGMSNHGMGTEQKKASGNLNLPPINIAASFGIGFAFEVSKIIDIYVGGSFEYGFLNMKSGDNGDLLYLDGNQSLQYRGILFSSITEKAHLVSAQGEIGMRVAIGKPFSRGGIRRR